MKAGIAITKEIRDSIRKEYLLMNLTNEELAKKYNVHPNTIYNLSQRENWDQLKEILSLEKYLTNLSERLCLLIKDRLGQPVNKLPEVKDGTPPTKEEADGETFLWKL